MTAPREPRSRLIIRRTVEAINGTGLNVLKFSSRVADSYRALVAANDRTLDFHESAGSLKSLLRAEKRNGNIVDRLLKGVVRFPADLEEAWVDALPEPHRADLVRELAARYGLNGARMPEASAHRHVVDLANVLRDAGEIAKALAPACADGLITSEDATHVAASLVEIDRALADLGSLRAQLVSAIATRSPSPLKAVS